jgi:serine phosphatase RsbU (regulator of sigma subunit)
MNTDYLNKRWRILAIDDSRLNRAIIRKVLSELNMEIDEAQDGQIGLDMLSKKKYDLILVDIIMPNLDGFGFLTKFKSVTNDEFIPAILMTGSDDLNSKIKGLRIGADDFLMKPLNEKELVARVLSSLRLKSAYSEIFEKNQLIQKEMEAARKVQEYIIPKKFDIIDYPLVTGRYLPIEDIGGDFYDCYKISDDMSGFLIADVTGHGIPAALVMSMAKMLFSVYASQLLSPKELFNKINKEIKNLLLDSQYITSFYAVYDRATCQLSVSNAGHVMPLFYRAEKNQVLALDTNGYFIGISDETRYEEKKLSVNKNDRLILFTDGITEIKNYAGEEFGDKKLAGFMKENSHLKGDEFCDALLKEVNLFSPLINRNDDIAFLNIEF